MDTPVAELFGETSGESGGVSGEIYVRFDETVMVLKEIRSDSRPKEVKVMA